MGETEIYQEKQIAAFVDILGFSQKLEKAGDDPVKLREIFDLLKKFYSWYEDSIYHQPYASEAGVESVKMFSDCMYISIDHLDCVECRNKIDITPYDHIGKFLNGLSLAQGCLVVGESFFLRGGIATGIKISDKHRVEASSAYFKAYKMESKEAIYPIILVEEGLAKKIKNLPGRECYNYSKREPLPNDHTCFLCRDKDERKFYILNYLFQIVFGDEDDPNYIMKRHKNNILKEFHENEEEEIKLKYRWLAIYYHNEFIEKYKKYRNLTHWIIDENEV